MSKKYLGIIAALCISTALATAITPNITVMADETETQAEARIYAGVHIGPVDVSNMTEEQAKEAVNQYMSELSQRVITLRLQDSEKQIPVTAENLGFIWNNPEVLTRAMELGRSGNIVKRYKEKKDIENDTISFDLEFTADENRILTLLEEQKANLEESAENASMQRTENGFRIIEGRTGKTVKTEEAVTQIQSFLLNEWDYKDASVTLPSEILEPTVTKEMCEKVSSTPMASFTTSYTSSGTSRSRNIDNAVEKINGTILLPGEQFSCLEHMVPFTAENGYYPAGSYYNGMLVDSYGGGVCQVSTTLYNAVLLAELEVKQRSNHGLTVGYVQLSSDAAIAESSNMDLVFVNNTNAPIYIEGYTKDKRVTFQLYGVDERPANRTIEYKNKILEVLNPPADVLTADHSLPAGARKVTQSSHTGYRAELYKYVYIDGVQQSVEKVNSSYYAPAPNYVSVGPGEEVEGENVSEEELPPSDIPVEAPVDNPTNSADQAPIDNPINPAEPSVENSAATEQPTENSATEPVTEAPAIQETTPAVQEETVPAMPTDGTEDSIPPFVG